MKKYFVILLIVLIGLLVSLSLSGCHKLIKSQGGTSGDLRTFTIPSHEMVLPGIHCRVRTVWSDW